MHDISWYCCLNVNNQQRKFCEDIYFFFFFTLFTFNIILHRLIMGIKIKNNDKTKSYIFSYSRVAYLAKKHNETYCPRVVQKGQIWWSCSRNTRQWSLWALFLHLFRAPALSPQCFFFLCFRGTFACTWCVAFQRISWSGWIGSEKVRQGNQKRLLNAKVPWKQCNV